MDLLDKVLFVFIKKFGIVLQDEKEKKGKDKEEYQNSNFICEIFDFVNFYYIVIFLVKFKWYFKIILNFVVIIESL